MDAYPEDYVVHNRPLILLSGLTQASLPASTADSPLLEVGALEISSSLPPIDPDVAEQLRSYFAEEAENGHSAQGRPAVAGARPIPFKVAFISRTYRMPPRKANRDLIQSISPSPPDALPPSHPLVLHSPLSPLSPGSPVFPDGLVTPLWVKKHQSLVPCAFISFFTLTADASLSALHDSQLKHDINDIKRSVAAASAGRTRYIVVLVSEHGAHSEPLPAPADLDERLTDIRRATGLDAAKTASLLLLLLPARESASGAALRDFARTTLAALQAPCVEYYRELAKHARRKRGRSAIPPPTLPPVQGTSQTLAGLGWNIRYDFKLGVFAAFRQELDSAARYFEAAYATLLEQDVFESIAGWSPRWNEARLLADVISVRVLRCLLWHGLTTAAVRRWQLHRVRMRDLVDRRGKGSANYGWEAWEAIWAKVMAELIQELQLPVFDVSDGGQLSNIGFWASPEKSVPVDERINPWQRLHHPGYWLQQVPRHLRARRKLAEAIPEEDRTSPGQSPASLVANKSYLYDTYLCPAPHREAPLPGHEGVDHSRMIVDSLERSLHEFARRGQKRAVERLRLDIAKEHMRAYRWLDAMRVIRPLWQSMTWRREGWWALVEEVCWALRTCAQHAGDGGSIVGVEWELMHELFAPRRDHVYDLANCLRDVANLRAKPAVVLRAGEVVSFVTVAYAFGSHEVTVGQRLVSQLVVTSHAHRDSVPVRIAQLQVSYDGPLMPVCIKDNNTHRDKGVSSTGQESYTEISLEIKSADYRGHITAPSAAAKACMVGEADLRLAPGQTKVFSFACTSREAGTARVKSVTLSIAEELFDVDYIVPFEAQRHAGEWWTRSRKGLKKQSLARENACVSKILPRPPRMQLYFASLRAEYYMNELITIALDVHNEEDEEIEVSLEVRILGDFESPPELTWDGRRLSESHGELPDEREEDFQPAAATAAGRAGTHRIGCLPSLAHVQTALSFRASAQPADYSIEVKAVYTLRSDPHTPLAKVVAAAFPVVAPFEVTFDFSPRVHPEPWPDYPQLAEAEAEAEAQEEKEKERAEEGVLEEKDREEEEEEEVVDPLNAVPRRRVPPTRRTGITQRWVLTAILVSLAQEDLYLDATQVQILGVGGKATCSVAQEKDEQEERIDHGANDDDNLDSAGAHLSPPPPLRIAAAGGQRLRFIVDVLKKSVLADRRPIALDLALAVTWRRPAPGSEPYAATISGSSSVGNATMTVNVPRLLVHAGEPRVLAAATSSLLSSSTFPSSSTAKADAGAEPDLLLLHLDYTVENPTPRPLALALLLEPSTDFAVVTSGVIGYGNDDDDDDDDDDDNGGIRHSAAGEAAAAATATRAQSQLEGAQTQLVQLAPISRHTVRFSVRPAVRGAWIRPQLRVLSPPPLLDRGSGPSFSPFSSRGMAAGTVNWPGAAVRVSATEAGGLRTDARGMLVWVDAED